MPRPYRLGQRQAATEQNRSRILQAARALLMENDGFSSFSIDLVARRADVARMTVYHQFGSKTGLLEALSDSLAANGGMQQLGDAFRQPDAWAALEQYIVTFGRFWDEDRLVMRRLRSLAALDPDFGQLVQTRDGWRRKGVGLLAERIVRQHLQSASQPATEIGADACTDREQQAALSLVPTEIVDVLFTLTAFETFDMLAGANHSIQEITPIVQKLAHTALLTLLPQKKS